MVTMWIIVHCVLRYGFFSETNIFTTQTGVFILAWCNSLPIIHHTSSMNSYEYLANFEPHYFQVTQMQNLRKIFYCLKNLVSKMIVINRKLNIYICIYICISFTKKPYVDYIFQPLTSAIAWLSK
jgi:hypothetical protein